ncbi:hypothetical protein EAE96_002914 [Botrytis aclada]|nr:hypothetical protein EAE96_002914 [Botrytis aclada]
MPPSMSSLNPPSSFPRLQTGQSQNKSLWNRTSPPSTAHQRRRSEYLSRSMANALGTIPLPNFNFEGRRPRRITSPLSDVKPIGYERGISREMGYSQFRISEIGEDVPSLGEGSGDEHSLIITQSLIRGIRPVRHGESSSRQDDNISVLDLETSVAGLNVNDESSPSKGRRFYGSLQGYVQYAHARAHTEDMGMRSSNIVSGRRDVTAIFRGPQVQSSLPLNSGTAFAPSRQFEPIGQRAVGYQHNRSMTSYGGPGQYMSQFDARVVGSSSNIDGDGTHNSQMPPNSFVQQQSNDFSRSLRTPFVNSHQGAFPAQYTPNATPTSVSSTVAQLSHRSETPYPPGRRPTDQLLREQGLVGPLPTNTPGATHHLSDPDESYAQKFGGEANLPNELNCAVWIQGIPKDFARELLYPELFNVVSIGPVIAAYICLGGDQHPHHAAKVVFKHPEHAARLIQRALFQGIYINGNRLQVEPNRHGHREFPLRLHYRSRVVLVEVFNNPHMDIGFWKVFMANLCVYDMENCRYLSYSSPDRIVMKFRFVRIFGQASILLAGIRSTASFEGVVTARYIPDVPCDICDVY